MRTRRGRTGCVAAVFAVGALLCAVPWAGAQDVAPAAAGEAVAEAAGSAGAQVMEELRTLRGELERMRSELDAAQQRSEELETTVQDLNQKLDGLAPADSVEEIQNAVDEVRKSVGTFEAELVEQAKTARGAEQAAEYVKDQLATSESYRFGGTLRLRGVQFKNVWSLDDDNGRDDWQWYRQRTWLWFDAQPVESAKAYVRLSNEYRWGDSLEENTLSAAGSRNAQSVYGNKQTFIESAYIDYTLPIDQDITLRLGRQGMIYGEGFVILDGMPYVGSTGLAFDALKATWKPDDKTVVDVFTGKYQENREADNDDHDFYGVYVTSSIIENHRGEFYVLYKDKKGEAYYTLGDPAEGDPAMLDPKQETWTLGTRWTGSVIENLSYAGEIAAQGGKLYDDDGNDDREGFAGYLRGTYKLADMPMEPAAQLGYIFYSGDDPETDKYEGWDSLYAQWPKYSELLAYTLYDPFFPLKNGNDPDLGMWTNIQMIQAGLDVSPIEKMKIALTYYYMLAEQDTGPGTGDERGSLLQAILTYKFNSSLSGHLWAEYFDPGDYYLSDADEAYFARWTLQLDF